MKNIQQGPLALPTTYEFAEKFSEALLNTPLLWLEEKGAMPCLQS
jgi:hypothetical protein